MTEKQNNKQGVSPLPCLILVSLFFVAALVLAGVAIHDLIEYWPKITLRGIVCAISAIPTTCAGFLFSALGLSAIRGGN